MSDDYKRIKDIVSLWVETQIGHHLKCREKQLEFSDIMWKLHKDQQNKKES